MPTYEIRRTLSVRPEEYDTAQGWLLGSGPATEEQAIEQAERHSRMGYPARVIKVDADGTRKCIWVRS